MPNHKPFNLHRLPAIYYALYWFSAFTFAFAMFFTLPVVDEDIALPLFSLLMQISSGLLAIVQAMELVVDPVPKWSSTICVVNLVGAFLYFYSSLKYDQFNKGELYLMGAFCVSLAFQLKILAIVIQEGRTISAIVRQEKYRFIRLACMAFGNLLFLSGSAIQQLGNGRSWTSGGLDLLGGLIAAGSALLLFRKVQHVGYAKFEQEMEIPTII